MPTSHALGAFSLGVLQGPRDAFYELRRARVGRQVNRDDVLVHDDRWRFASDRVGLYDDSCHSALLCSFDRSTHRSEIPDQHGPVSMDGVVELIEGGQGRDALTRLVRDRCR
ncbi:MAG: hypothetical protein QOF25_4055 [Mycobacterium sp.]|nr:hypothetical protein [Mycobacterium sp.]